MRRSRRRGFTGRRRRKSNNRSLKKFRNYTVSRGGIRL